MNNFWLDRKQERQCSYRKLTKGEIKKLKDNGPDYDPHRIKRSFGAPRLDLFKCSKSGKLAIGPTEKQPNVHYYDTCINIDELPWSKGKPTVEERIQFCVRGFRKAPEAFLEQLGLERADEIWHKGERVGASILEYPDNGFIISDSGSSKPFANRLADLLKRVYPLSAKLAKTRSKRELECVFYLSDDERPEIHIPNRLLKKLNALQAAVDVDIYYLGEET